MAKIYLEELNDKFIKPKEEKNVENVYHIFPIRFHERDKLSQYLKRKNISTLIHYPTPPYLQKFYKKNKNQDYPISNEIHKTIFKFTNFYNTCKRKRYYENNRYY